MNCSWAKKNCVAVTTLADEGAELSVVVCLDTHSSIPTRLGDNDCCRNWATSFLSLGSIIGRIEAASSCPLLDPQGVPPAAVTVVAKIATTARIGVEERERGKSMMI